MGLSQSHARQRLRQLHDDVRLRSIGHPCVADEHDVHDLLPQQVLLVHDDEEREQYLRHLDQLHLERRYPARDYRSTPYNGAATGSPITRYIHPDHLGSTNVVTDASGTVAQLLDYYPYGATRISSNTYPTNEKRQYIGQFSDAQTNLSYLNARYYDSARGQFISQDPVFWAKQNLTDPQSLNAYSYAQDNPVTKKDPNGLAAAPSTTFWQAVVNFLQSYVSYLQGGGGTGGGGSSGVQIAPKSNSNNGTPTPSGSQAPYYGGGGSTYSPTILNIAPQSDANNSQLPDYANVYSQKYGYSKKLPRDFSKIKEDAENGDLQYRGQYVNGKGALPSDEAYSEYTLPTPEMAQDLNLPPGTVGPERVIEGDSSGDLYYTASHYIGRFLNLKNGNIIPGEGGESIPLEF